MLIYLKEKGIFRIGIILFIVIGNLIFKLKQILKKDHYINKLKNNNNKNILKKKQ